MSRGLPSMTALLGMLVLAGFRTEIKLSRCSRRLARARCATAVSKGRDGLLAGLGSNMSSNTRPQRGLRLYPNYHPGIVGAFIATFLRRALGWYRLGEGAGLIGAVVGASSCWSCTAMIANRRTV